MKRWNQTACLLACLFLTVGRTSFATAQEDSDPLEDRPVVIAVETVEAIDDDGKEGKQAKSKSHRNRRQIIRLRRSDRNQDGKSGKADARVNVDARAIVLDQNGKKIEVNLEDIAGELADTITVVGDEGVKTIGKTNQFMIGLYCTTISDLVKSQLKIKHGLAVEDVVEDSPAGAAGVKKHDILLSIDDNEVSDVADLVVAVQKSKGAEVTIKLVRGGKTRDVSLTPKKRSMEDVTSFYSELQNEFPRDWKGIVVLGDDGGKATWSFNRFGPGYLIDSDEAFDVTDGGSMANFQWHGGQTGLDARIQKLEKAIDKLTRSMEKLTGTNESSDDDSDE